MPPDRCPNCDRDVAGHRVLAYDDITMRCDRADCCLHRVDWRKRAMESAAEIERLHKVMDGKGCTHCMSDTHTTLEHDALAESAAYARGIEDAARECDVLAERWGLPEGSVAAKECAHRIRALATKEPRHGK